MEGEEFELDDLNTEFPEYDDQSTENLDENLNSLRERLLFENDPLITERITYINNLLDARVRETDFGGVDWRDRGDSRLVVGDVRDDMLIQIDKYVQDSRGGKLNPRTDSALELRRRTTTKDGKIMFKVKLKNGGLSSVDSIVLNRNGDKYEENTAKRNATAVEQFNDLINKGVEESRDRFITTSELPMVEKIGGLSRDVFERLNEQDQRVVNGVLNPSDTILPESRIGDRGAIQLMIDDFVERGDTIRERLRDSDVGEAQKLFQESSDLDIVVDAFERQRIREETRVEQEEDITRLQKLKKWLKENWLGLSALGITVASLVTTIIVGTRNVITKGANAVKTFAKAVKNAISKLGPWATSLANLVYNIIKAGASGLVWLSKNLWIFVITVSYFLWEMYKNKNKK